MFAGSKGTGDAYSVLRPNPQKKTEPIIATAWSADDTTIISADKGGTVSFWSLVGL